MLGLLYLLAAGLIYIGTVISIGYRTYICWDCYIYWLQDYICWDCYIYWLQDLYMLGRHGCKLPAASST